MPQYEVTVETLVSRTDKLEAASMAAAVEAAQALVLKYPDQAVPITWTATDLASGNFKGGHGQVKQEDTL